MYCFNNWEEPGWIEVCAGCLQGFCMEHINFHMATHSAHLCCVKTSMRTMVIVEDESRDVADSNATLPEKEFQLNIPGQKITYDHTFIPYCYRCQNQLNIPSNDPLLKYITESVEASKIQTYSWSDEIKPCKHIAALQQSDAHAESKLSCACCDVRDNLWMCLSCGEVGCGRRQADGSGGNGHASHHFSATTHSCSLKLGTIRNACPDVHCYECDEMVLDNNLAEHLEKLNVDASSVPFEKGMAELQWEQNQHFDFSMSTDDGKQFEKALGFPGISNLGNSCYISSIMQPLVRLIHGLPNHDISNCSLEPKDCTMCQFEKIKKALLDNGDQEQKIEPWMFKLLVSSGHSEFSSSRQQDAAEFFAHILKSLKAYEPFAFDLQQTLLCPECGFTRSSITRCDYLQTDISQTSTDQSCSLNNLVESFFAPELVQLQCARCGQSSCTKRFGIVCGPKEC
jgi:ubiquitin carboxyl-terminal hydrolase 5/13